MTIKYGWLIDQEVMLTQMIGIVSNQEYQQWADETKILYDAIPYDRFHILVDCTELEKIPMLNDLLNIHFHEKRAWIIVCGLQNQLLQFAASMVLQVTRTNMKLVNSLEEAITILNRVDTTIAIPESPQIVGLKIISDGQVLH